jgi:hypothetical protein
MAKLVQALELDRDGDWDGAHRIVQAMDFLEANWIHAYLHRKEGVLWNARYWYDRVNKPMPQYGLDREWKELYEVATNP